MKGKIYQIARVESTDDSLNTTEVTIQRRLTVMLRSFRKIFWYSHILECLDLFLKIKVA